MLAIGSNEEGFPKCGCLDGAPPRPGRGERSVDTVLKGHRCGCLGGRHVGFTLTNWATLETSDIPSVI